VRCCHEGGGGTRPGVLSLETMTSDEGVSIWMSTSPPRSRTVSLDLLGPLLPYRLSYGDTAACIKIDTVALHHSRDEAQALNMMMSGERPVPPQPHCKNACNDSIAWSAERSAAHDLHVFPTLFTIQHGAHYRVVAMVH